MSYKSRMCPKVSKGEISVFSALSSAGLTSGMVTQQPIILKATIPDFCWFELKKAVYLDGVQVHRKDKQQQKDAEIVDLLEQKGWDVLRIPYEPPLTASEVQEITENIRRFIGLIEE
ncbi:MAG: endonuclease domain-containing protein [Candidatus Bathyarchaeota archaeon]|nr:endonuclease domain-containing protein [Candidatus Termiticorpusculum sp.]